MGDYVIIATILLNSCFNLYVIFRDNGKSIGKKIDRVLDNQQSADVRMTRLETTQQQHCDAIQENKDNLKEFKRNYYLKFGEQNG